MHVHLVRQPLFIFRLMHLSDIGLSEFLDGEDSYVILASPFILIYLLLRRSKVVQVN